MCTVCALVAAMHSSPAEPVRLRVGCSDNLARVLVKGSASECDQGLVEVFVYGCFNVYSTGSSRTCCVGRWRSRF